MDGLALVVLPTKEDSVQTVEVQNLLLLKPVDGLALVVLPTKENSVQTAEVQNLLEHHCINVTNAVMK